MASSITTNGGDAWLDMLTGVQPLPTEYYVALTTGVPALDDDGTTLSDVEVAGASYARQSIATGVDAWAPAAAHTISNLISLDFGEAEEDWGIITHFVLCTAVTGGETYAFGEFSTPQRVMAGNSVIIGQGGLVLTISSPDSMGVL